MAPYQTIKDWPEEDRPREKLLAKGPQSLSETELLAIILRNGNASTGASAIDHARLLLSQFGGLKGIDEASITELATVKGIGPAKIAEIKACLEIAKRMGSQKWQTGEPLRSSEDVYHHFRENLGREKRELFYVVLLNNKNR
jgi:DNA repair protein RadC